MLVVGHGVQGTAGERGTGERKEKTVCKRGNMVLFYTVREELEGDVC